MTPLMFDLFGIATISITNILNIVSRFLCARHLGNTTPQSFSSFALKDCLRQFHRDHHFIPTYLFPTSSNLFFPSLITVALLIGLIYDALIIILHRGCLLHCLTVTILYERTTNLDNLLSSFFGGRRDMNISTIKTFSHGVLVLSTCLL